MKPFLPPGLTERISLTICAMAAVVTIVNFSEYYFVQSHTLAETVVTPQVWSLLVFAVFFGAARFVPQRAIQVIQAVLILGLSGPMTLAGTFTFFGMWFFVLGIILLYKYGFLNRAPVPKVLLVALYYVPFLIASVLNNEGLVNSTSRVVDYVLFLMCCFVFLYFIFEAEIRDLVSKNSQKDRALAEKTQEIARMEPLSVLGERVAHVTHGFKSHLIDLRAIVSRLEVNSDSELYAGQLKKVSDSLAERIEAILMVSRAGADLVPETFDASRVLEGMRFVYLSEPSFANEVWHEVALLGPTVVRAVRWDFILMVENILKNALEAIQSKRVRGIVRIELSGGLLSISNNGGAMDQCPNCTGYCLNCSVYGKSGGLGQVFSTCKKNGWALRIRTDEDWTFYQVLLKAPSGETS